jgi:protein-disulfide isomerase
MTKQGRGKKNKPTVGKRQLRLQRRANQQRQRFLLIGIFVLGGIFAAAYAFLPRGAVEKVTEARLMDDPSRGEVSAPVTITEFGDFGCHACQAWHQAGILEQIKATYGDQVRIVWRDLPIITAQSPKAAEAAQCAHDQDRFWAYHDLLFAQAPRLGVRDLKTYAGEIGLDMEQFYQCLDSGLHKDTVDRDLQDAFRRGFQGTPSFMVNGQALIGPTPERMIQMIEAILANS